MNGQRVGGVLDWRDMADPRRAQQGDAIRRLAAEGHHETTIATATGLSVEVVRRTLAERGTAVDGAKAQPLELAARRTTREPAQGAAGAAPIRGPASEPER